MHCTKERFRCPAQNRNSNWLTSEGVEWKEGFDKKKKKIGIVYFSDLHHQSKLNPSLNAETNAMPCYLVSVEELGVLLVVRVLTERAGARQCPCVGCERSVALSTAPAHGGVLLAVQPVTHISHLRLCWCTIQQQNNTHLRLCCCVGLHCTIQHCLVTHISHLRLCCCYVQYTPSLTDLSHMVYFASGSQYDLMIIYTNSPCWTIILIQSILGFYFQVRKED